MQKIAVLSAMIAFSGALTAAEIAPKDEVLSAAKKLGDQASYSWRTTVDVPEGTRFRPGPVEGKTEKNGFTWLSMTFGNTTMQAAMKGDKAALQTDEGWQALSEMESSEGPGRFRAMMLRNIKLPAAQAADLIAAARTLKKDGDVYSGALTEEGVKALLTSGFRGRGADGPAIQDPAGSVKFWTRDGVLSKYVFDVKGTMTFNNNDVRMDRTTTVELRDIDSTKVEIPAEAKKKLGT
jgi:hypothetical protein